MHNPRLDGLDDYFFRRLSMLLASTPQAPGLAPIDLSIGQPMHETPALLHTVLSANGHLWGRYPPVAGSIPFRQAVAEWLTWRYQLEPEMIDAERHVLPVAGTKEALFLLPLLVTPLRKNGQVPAVLFPNPFYNVYQGAALAAGAEPVLLSVGAASDHLPDLDSLTPELLARTAAFYLCTPSNPQGTVAGLDYLVRAIRLAREHDFLLIVDECYSEIYGGAPPPGGLQAAAASGALDHLIVCNSLSKRSSVPGLRSGFVAGDPQIISAFARLRSYGAAVQPLPVLAVATALWGDERHVEANRRLYQEKFDLADRWLTGHFDYYRPAGGFFLWLNVGDSEAITKRLWSEAAVKVVPGAYLGRPDRSGWNPGAAAIRVALVQDAATTEEALRRIVATLA